MTPLNILGDSIHQYEYSLFLFQQSPKFTGENSKITIQRICRAIAVAAPSFLCLQDTHTQASLMLKHKSSKPYILCLQSQTWYTEAKMARVWGEPGLYCATLYRNKKKSLRQWMSSYPLILTGSIASYIAREGFKGSEWGKNFQDMVIV